MKSLDLHLPLVIVGFLVPFLTALLTKWKAPDIVKGLVTVTLVVALSLARTLVDSDLGLTWHTFSTGFLEIWLTALVSWLGLTGDFTAKLNQLTGNFGIGGVAAIEPVKPTPAPAVPDVPPDPLDGH